MTTTKRWRVEIFIDEHEGATQAEARLHTLDNTHLAAVGRARLNPRDFNVPEIGDELATARALAALADRLRQAASDDIEGLTGEPVHISRS